MLLLSRTKRGLRIPKRRTPCQEQVTSWITPARIPAASSAVSTKQELTNSARLDNVHWTTSLRSVFELIKTVNLLKVKYSCGSLKRATSCPPLLSADCALNKPIRINRSCSSVNTMFCTSWWYSGHRLEFLPSSTCGHNIERIVWNSITPGPVIKNII